MKIDFVRLLGKVWGRMNFISANWLTILLSSTCIAFAGWFVKVSSERQLTSFEAVLAQIVIVSTGVWASYLFSQKSARKSMKPHARSAFRRVKNLYSGLFYIKRIIEQGRRSDSKDVGHVVPVIEAVVDQQVNTVADAMGDWRDMVPEDVADIERQVVEHAIVEQEDLRR